MPKTKHFHADYTVRYQSGTSLVAHLVKNLPAMQIACSNSLIARLGRSTEEGKGHLLQYSLVSLVAQTVKNLSAMWETWV